MIIRVWVLLLKLWLHGVERTSAQRVGAQRISAQRVGAQRGALQHELSLITLWLWCAQRPGAACCCASSGSGLSLAAAPLHAAAPLDAQRDLSVFIILLFLSSYS